MIQFKNETEALAWARMVAADWSNGERGSGVCPTLAQCFETADEVVAAMRERSAEMNREDEEAEADYKTRREAYDKRQGDLARQLGEFQETLQAFMRAMGYSPPPAATAPGGAS